MDADCKCGHAKDDHTGIQNCGYCCVTERGTPPHRCYCTDYTPAPPAVLGEPLDELERRAKAVQACIAAEEGYWRRSHDFTRAEAHQLAQATASAKAMLAALCTPERIARLVALARAGMEDTELLDGMLDDVLSTMREPMTLSDAREARDMLTHVRVTRKKAAVRAARALAGPGGENA